MNVISQHQKAFVALRVIRDRLDSLNQQRKYTLPVAVPKKVRTYIEQINSIVEEGLVSAEMPQNNKPMVIVPKVAARADESEVEPKIVKRQEGEE